MSLTNIVNQAKRLKRGLEDPVSDGVDLNGGPAATTTPVVEQAIAPAKARHEPVQARQAERQGDGLLIAKGSRLAPKRESSADRIDGRAARATGRNSRINLQIRPLELDVFKEECEIEGICYNAEFESMIRKRWPDRFK